jgi:ubiquinone biosynthesis protein
MSFLPEPFTRHARRAGEVASILAKYGLADWLSHIGAPFPKHLLKDADGELLTGHSRAVRVRMAVVELGTTFIKLGQMLSTRPDLVGWEIAEELARLQEGVPPDPPEVAMTTVSAELGRPISELFAEFDPEPIASASIAQVHGAKLLDGTSVVVKVQHPGIEARIRADLEILQLLADFSERSEELKRFQPGAIVGEFHRSLRRELDFAREERNMQQFAANFRHDPTVCFPHTYPELSTSRVLTMERLDGISLRDPANLENVAVDRDELARRGATVWMEMLFRDGFYHADPHPGNICVLADGRLAIMDCGMVGRVDEQLRESIEEILVTVASGDALHLARLLARLCTPPSDLGEAALSTELADFISFYGSQPLERFQLGGALNEIVRCISRYQLILPSSLAQILKMLAMLDGTARLLSSRINLLDVIRPYHRKIFMRYLSPRRQLRRLQRLLSEWGYLAQTLPRNVGDVFDQIQKGRFDIHLEHRRLEPSVNRLVMGLVCSAMFLGAAMLLSFEVPPRIGEHSVIGWIMFLISSALGLRLLWKVWRNE